LKSVSPVKLIYRLGGAACCVPCVAVERPLERPLRHAGRLQAPGLARL